MKDRDLWITIRRALLMIAKAIEDYYLAESDKDSV